MTQLYFVKEGAWAKRAPVVVLAHALGCDHQMYDAVADLLSPSYALLRYDHRGHGQSPSPDGPWRIEDFAADAASLIEREVLPHGSTQVHFVGVSLGGMVAQALADARPDLVASLVVANSALVYGSAARAMWAERVQTVAAQGMSAVLDGAMERCFTPEFRASNPAPLRQARATLAACEPHAYARACEAAAGIDFTFSNSMVQCPVLVLAGARDEATPPAMSEAILQSLVSGMWEEIDTAHLSATEDPEAFANAVARFLMQVESGQLQE